jgi:integrase
MGLEITRNQDGSPRSKWWYGNFTVGGERKYINLGIEICGQVPTSLKETGDVAFERSRMKAQLKMDAFRQDAHSRKSAVHHLQELYEIKAGEELTQIPLAEMAERWNLLPTKKKRCALRTENQLTTIRQFQKFMTANFPQATTMSQITRKMALAWMKSLDDLGMAGATYNTKLSLLKGIFEKLGSEAGVLTNPFNGIPFHETNTMHRQPFTQKELNAILAHCDDLIRPVVLTAMCTAMRRGDCAMLKWESVDLENGFISVKTSKTGELAEIPLFPLLRAELEKLPRKSIYVFPDVAKMYKANLMGLTWRFKKAINDAKIEGAVIERDDAMQNASVKDFHSLRTTWITMALTAGVPMELVRRVTGHSTVDVVLKHYFRPGREAFKVALETAMPKMLTGGEKSEDGDQKTENGEQKPDENMQKMLKKIQGLLEYGEDMEKAAILRRLTEIAKEMTDQLRQGQDGQNTSLAA